MLEIIVFFILLCVLWVFRAKLFSSKFAPSAVHAPQSSSKSAPSAVTLQAGKQTTSSKSPASSSIKIKLPEDSVLKRHFLAQLQAEIESTLFPRPTDSVLQRHYDSLVASKLENCLAELS